MITFKRPAYLLSCILLLALISACATSPTGRSQLLLFTTDELAKMGIDAFDEIKNKNKEEDAIVTDPVYVDYIDCIVDAIVEVLPAADDDSDNGNTNDWEVVIFNNQAVNAFALPGKKIGVHTGIMHPAIANNQHQLAAVIGHEIAHVLADHSNERLSYQLITDIGLKTASQVLGQSGSASNRLILAGLGLGTEVGVLLPFSRKHETEADIYGLRLIAGSGFDPRGSAKLWENIAASKDKKPPVWLSTHPSDAARIQHLNDYTEKTALKLYREAQAAGRQPDCQPPDFYLASPDETLADSRAKSP